MVALASSFALMNPSTGFASDQKLVRVTTADGLELTATLVLPEASKARVPAALLIQGSGPTNRDGNQPPRWMPSTLRRIAASLAEHGIASLRFDKRGMNANASQRPRERAQWADFFRWERFVADVRSAYRTLCRHPRVDQGSTYVIGHSEGGLLALELVGRSQQTPNGVVLLATPGRPPGDLLLEQVDRILDSQGASPKLKAQFLEAQRQIHRNIRANGVVPSTVPPGLAALYQPYLGPFLQSFLSLKPEALLRRVDVPTLAIFGRADGQVSAAQDGAVFKRVANERSNGSRVVVLENSNHVLQADASSVPLDKPLHPDVMRAIISFVLSTSSVRSQR